MTDQPPIPTQGFYHAHCDDVITYEPYKPCGWDRAKIDLHDVEAHRRETRRCTVIVTTLIDPAVGHERAWAKRYGRG